MAQANLNEARLGWPAEPAEAVGGSLTGSADRINANRGNGLEGGQRCRIGNVGLKSSQGELGGHVVHGVVKVHSQTLASR